MSAVIVQAPVALLLEPGLTAADKLVWLARHLQSKRPTLAILQASSGLSVVTIRKSLSRLPAATWDGPAVQMPVSLLSDPQVRPGAKVLFGLLQTLREGAFAYGSLTRLTGSSVVTVRESIKELVAADWVETTQANRKAPVRFTLHLPVDDEVARARHRLEQFQFTGESIMKEYLSLLINSDEFEDNARPGFLINPLTNERMELDRYYPPRVAFEYNGWQHYRTTRRFPSEAKLAALMARDLMKAALCAQRGITVVTIHREDLNLQAMQAKVGNLLPLRDLRHHTALIEYLAKQ